MRRCIFAVGVLVVVLAASTRTQTPSWSFKAEDIEACSCELLLPVLLEHDA